MKSEVEDVVMDMCSYVFHLISLSVYRSVSEERDERSRVASPL